MKVCILTGSYPAYKGNIRGMFVYNLTKTLADKRINIEVVSPYYKESKKKEEDIGKIKVTRFQYFYPVSLQRLTSKGGIPTNLKKSLLAKLQLPFFMLSMLRTGLKASKRCDIIHAQWSLAGLIGVFLKKINKKRLIITIRGSDVKLALKNSLFKRIIKLVYKNADSITTVSDDLKKDILNLGIKKNKVIMIPNGVDSNIFKKRDKIKARKKIGLNRKRKLILCVGHLIKAKGIGYLIDSAPYINADILLIGEGSDESLFRKKIKSLGLKNVFFPGTKKQRKLAYYYNAADIFILPSLSEGRPNTVIEAMSSGTPVISTNVGGIPELIGDNRGIIIRPKNKQDIINNINKLLKNKKLSEKLTSNASKFISKLSWNSCAEQYIKEYKNI